MASSSDRLPRLALVATVRNVAATIASFIRYHRAIGFDRLFLFFDDPADPAIPIAKAHDGVTVIRHDNALRREWESARFYDQPWCKPCIDREVMTRQILNADVALRLAHIAGYDWLLHIDADELFHPHRQLAPLHFRDLDQHGFNSVTYPNHEVLPEQADYTDYFAEATLFKINPIISRKAVNFQFYSNGKSAIRVHPSAQPQGVHRFSRDQQNHHLARNGSCILHYACCGFNHWYQKYQTLGAFNDHWWGTQSINQHIGHMHTASRDIVQNKSLEEARAFYHQHFVANQTTIQAGLDKRIFQRIVLPQFILLNHEYPLSFRRQGRA